MSSGAIFTPFSISTKDETHARFQRLVPPGNGQLDFHAPWQHQALGTEGCDRASAKDYAAFLGFFSLELS